MNTPITKAMDDDLMEARGLLAELSGVLEAYSLSATDGWLAEALRHKANRIDAFLNGDDTK